MLTFIWAEDINHAIGINGHLPWHLPADLHHFKEKTMGHPILMGRKTFESFPNLLPGRKHIVLTHSQDFFNKYQDNNQVVVLRSKAELNKWLEENKDENIGVIGGASVFKMLLNKVDCLEKTVIYDEFNADTFMPEINYNDFKLVAKEDHKPDGKNKYNYSFLTYFRK